MTIKPVDSNSKWINRPIPLKARSKFYKFISVISKPFSQQTSEYYTFRAFRADEKKNLYARNKTIQKVFNEHRVAGALNLSKPPASPKEMKQWKKEKEALRDDLIDFMKETSPEFKISKVPISSLETNGSCLGNAIDFAHHCLSHPNEKEAYFNKIATGVTKEAELYQGASNGLVMEIPKKALIPSFFQALAQNRPDTYLAPLFPIAKESHVQLLSSNLFDADWMKNPGELAKHNQAQKLSQAGQHEDFLFSSNNKQVEAGLKYVMAKTIQELGEKAWHNDELNISLIHQTSTKVIEDIYKRKYEETSSKETKQLLAEQRTLLIGDLKMAVAIQEFLSGKKISDPFIEKVFDNSTKHPVFKNIAAMTGLEMQAALPPHFFFLDDSEYLSQMAQLEPGFNSLVIETEKGSHAISYVKEADGSGYIVDPNAMILKFPSSADSITLMKQVLNHYGEPGNPIRNHPNHQLTTYRIQKKSIEN